MCAFSATTENTRDARRGETLVVSPAPHGVSNAKWLTESGKPGIAVCVPPGAVLSIQKPGKKEVRGATFEQAKNQQDFLNFLDGKKERMALNDVPSGTMITLLQYAPIATPATPVAEQGELVTAGSRNL